MSPVRMARLESAMRIALAYKDAFNQHDITGILALLSEDCTLESENPPPEGQICHGKAAIHDFFSEHFQRLPQAQIKIEEIFGFGDRCIMRWRCEWIDATGTPRHIRGADIFKVKDDLICEKFAYAKG